VDELQWERYSSREASGMQMAIEKKGAKSSLKRCEDQVMVTGVGVAKLNLVA